MVAPRSRWGISIINMIQLLHSYYEISIDVSATICNEESNHVTGTRLRYESVLSTSWQQQLVWNWKRRRLIAR
jgi:hypothetical protein